MLTFYGSRENITKIVSINILLSNCCFMHKLTSYIDEDVVRKLT